MQTKVYRVTRDGTCILTTFDPLKVVELAVRLSKYDVEWWVDEEVVR